MAKALRINEFKSQIDTLLNNLPTEMLKINKQIALDAIPKITSRLTDLGLTAEGRSLGTYSTRPMSPLFFLGHGLKSADAKIKSQIKKQVKSGQRPGVSYEQIRQFNNLPTDHVTLSFTNDTLGDIGVLTDTIEGNSVITTIGSKDSKSKDIFNSKGKKTGEIGTGEVLDRLEEKYGSALDTELLSLSTEEENDSSEVLDEKLQNFLDKYFA